MDSDHEEASNQDNIHLDEDKSAGRLIPGLLFALLAAGLVAAALYLVLKPPVVHVVRRVESRRCVRCHAELLPKLKMKDQKSIHWPFQDQACTECHLRHGDTELDALTSRNVIKGSSVTRATAKDRSARFYMTKDEAPRPAARSGLKEPVGKMCGERCHQDTMDQLGKKYAMPPFAKKQCLSCHDPHSSKQVRLTRAPTRVLCISCHPKIAEFYTKSTIHPPFKIGICTSCHRPHSSNFKPMLRRPPKVLCLSCHPSIAKLQATSAVKMRPFEDGQCTKCHNPHGTNNKKLLVAPIPTLCFRCHKQIGDLQKKAVMMPPFREGKCLNCHFPMGGPNKKLLREPLEGNELCFSCHDKFEPGKGQVLRKNFKGIGHSKVVSNASPYQPEGGVGSCLNCHEPHSSNFARLLQKEQISLCLSCHGPRRYFAHPIGFKFEDPRRGGYLRCGSCHNPMGSGLSKLKRPPNDLQPFAPGPLAAGQTDPMDGLCTSCHNKKDPSYIYFSSEGKKFHTYQIFDSQ